MDDYRVITLVLMISGTVDDDMNWDSRLTLHLNNEIRKARASGTNWKLVSFAAQGSPYKSMDNMLINYNITLQRP